MPFNIDFLGQWSWIPGVTDLWSMWLVGMLQVPCITMYWFKNIFPVQFGVMIFSIDGAHAFEFAILNQLLNEYWIFFCTTEIQTTVYQRILYVTGEYINLAPCGAYEDVCTSEDSWKMLTSWKLIDVGSPIPVFCFTLEFSIDFGFEMLINFTQWQILHENRSEIVNFSVLHLIFWKKLGCTNTFSLTAAFCLLLTKQLMGNYVRLVKF